MHKQALGLMGFLAFAVVALAILMVIPNFTQQLEKVPLVRDVKELVAGYCSSDSCDGPSINIVAVTCGDEERVNETLVNFKSALLFSKQPLNFHVFAEEHLHEKFEKGFAEFSRKSRTRFTYSLRPITYPDDKHATQWKALFKPCASQRLFLPDLLPDVDAILYVDTDVLFLTPVEQVWKEFEKMDETELASMSPEHEETSVSWYSRFARHPYYGATGINSGVMWMNLTRVRAATFKNDVAASALRWQDMMVPLLQKYRLNITWGDQDLLNVIFHHNPEKLRLVGCEWNYRPDHCMYMSICRGAERVGARILHGCRRSFVVDKWPVFRTIHRALRDQPLEARASNLLARIWEKLKDVRETNCKKCAHIILKQLQALELDGND